MIQLFRHRFKRLPSYDNLRQLEYCFYLKNGIHHELTQLRAVDSLFCQGLHDPELFYSLICQAKLNPKWGCICYQQSSAANTGTRKR